MHYPKTYYADTVTDSDSFSPLEEDLDVEICIIGGGYAGLSTALGLVERGKTDIALIDANGIGFGCSGRNGGFVFGGYSLGERALLRRVGPDRARALYALTTQGVDLIRKRIHTYQIDCEAVWDGVLLCNWFKDDAILSDHRRFMSDTFGVDLEAIEADALREILLTTRYSGALLESDAFHINPLKYALGLATQIKSAGGRVHSATRAIRVDVDGVEKTVETPAGRIRAKQLVICCGGYLDGLHKPLARASMPIGTYVMVTEPLGDRMQEAINCQYAIYDTRFAFDYYRPLVDGRLMWGGRVSTTSREPAALDQLLYGDLMKVYPQLEGVKVDYAWQGLMSWSAHKMPQVGEERPGVWYAQAFGGHGVSTTNIVGDMLAAAISEQDTGYRKISDEFGLTSLYGPLGKLGAEATYRWYQMRDWAKS